MAAEVDPAVPLTRSRVWPLWLHHARRRPGGERPLPTPLAARTAGYARLIAAYLRDRPGEEALTVLLPRAGDGALATALLAALRRQAPQDAWRLVLADPSPELVAAWRGREPLAAGLRDGRLDAACYSWGEPRMALASGGELSPDRPCGDLVLLADGLLGRLPQDVFRVRNRTLRACHVALVVPRDGGDDPSALGLRYAEAPVSFPVYGEPHWNVEVDGYGRKLRKGSFCFPTMALEGLATLRTMSGGRCLLLAADLGTVRAAEREGESPPRLRLDAEGFALPVDFAILAGCARASGGDARVSSPRLGGLHVGAFLAAGSFDELPHFQAAWCDWPERFGPADTASLCASLPDPSESLGGFLAAMRLACADPTIFWERREALLRKAPGVPLHERPAVLALLEAVAEHRWGPPRAALLVCLARVAQRVQGWEEACGYFRAAIEAGAEEAELLAAFGRCLYGLRCRTDWWGMATAHARSALYAPAQHTADAWTALERVCAQLAALAEETEDALERRALATCWRLLRDDEPAFARFRGAAFAALFESDPFGTEKNLEAPL